MRGGLCCPGFDVHVRARVPRAPPGRAGKLSIIGLIIIQWGATMCWWIIMDFEPRTTNNTLDLIVRTVSWPDTWCSNDGRRLLGEGTPHRGVESVCDCLRNAGLDCVYKFLRLRWTLQEFHTFSFAPRAARTWRLDVMSTSPLLLTTWRQSTETCGRKNAQFLRRGCPHCSHTIPGKYLYESLVS